MLLREAMQRVRLAGFIAANIDATIIAEAPKLAPYIERMVSNIAADLSLEPGAVNVKAKTAERLGALGRGEGIAAEAIALIESHPT